MDNLKNEIKSFAARAILIGAIGAAILFVYSLFLQKEWLVTGKVAVFPSGLVSAQQNLGYEVGNTVEIINSDSFQKIIFQGKASNFSDAEALGSSSVVAVNFLSRENDINSFENLLVEVPGQLADYTRDLYGGNPYKYKLIGDPEISTSPVKPNIVGNVSWGFLGGGLAFFIYWLFFELLRVRKEKEEGNRDSFRYQPSATVVSPKMEEAEPEAKSFVPSQPSREKEKTKSVGEALMDSVPSNLPVAETETPTKNIPETGQRQEFGFEEPTDDEIKERLNRLMRGEL